MWLLPLSLALSYPNPGNAAALDDALALVLRVSPQLAEKVAETNAIAMQHAWSSKVRLGYHAEGTDAEAEGINAGFVLDIPLFSNKHKIDAAKARHQLAQSRQAVIKDFLSSVSKLVDIDLQRIEAEEMRSFYRDRLEYFKQSVDEGMHEPETLWSDAEKAKNAEHAMHQAKAQYDSELMTVARRFGEQEWKTLQGLLRECVSQGIVDSATNRAPTATTGQINTLKREAEPVRQTNAAVDINKETAQTIQKTYPVSNSSTLWSISRETGVSQEAIRQHNPHAFNGDVLLAGKNLVLQYDVD